MPADKLLVTLGGFFSVLFVYWYFFMKNEQTVEAVDSIDILVDGGYKPEKISIPYGKKTKINFLRKDSNSCLEDVILSDFKIKKDLSMNEKVTIEITPNKKGEFNFSCGMGMFHGKLIVK